MRSLWLPFLYFRNNNTSVHVTNNAILNRQMLRTYQVPGMCVPGTWYLVPGTWCVLFGVLLRRGIEQVKQSMYLQSVLIVL